MCETLKTLHYFDVRTKSSEISNLRIENEKAYSQVNDLESRNRKLESDLPEAQLNFKTAAEKVAELKNEKAGLTKGLNEALNELNLWKSCQQELLKLLSELVRLLRIQSERRSYSLIEDTANGAIDYALLQLAVVYLNHPSDFSSLSIKNLKDDKLLDEGPSNEEEEIVLLGKDPISLYAKIGGILSRAEKNLLSDKHKASKTSPGGHVGASIEPTEEVMQDDRIYRIRFVLHDHQVEGTQKPFVGAMDKTPPKEVLYRN